MYDCTFNIIIFGEDSNGKTTFLQKFVSNLFVSDPTVTIGIEIYTKLVSVDRIRVMLQIRVLSGEKRFWFLIPTRVKGARGGLFVFDIADSSSIAHIDDWLSVIREGIRTEDLFPIFLVGILPDERNERQVSTEEGIKIAKSRNLRGFVECNMDTGENVEKAFEVLTRLILAAIK